MLVPVGLRGEDDAGANGLAVQQDGARPANPVLAAKMKARQAGVPKGVGKRPMPGNVERRVCSIEPAAHR